MNRWPLKHVSWLLAGLLSLGLVASCSELDEQQSGGIAVQVRWGNSGALLPQGIAPAPLNHPPSVISIVASVFGSGMEPREETFAASAQSGTIDNIPAGGGRILQLDGKDASDTTIYQKTTTGITVTAGAAEPVNVVMEPAFPAPGDVTGLAAVPGDGGIVLTWSNPGDADFAGVMIRRSSADAPSTYSDGNQVYDGALSTFTDTGLTNGTTYYYTAFCYNTTGIYSGGTTVSGTPTATATSAPTGVAASPGDGEVTIS